MNTGNLRIINTLGKDNRRTLLKKFEHNNINEAIKHYTGIVKKQYSDEEKQHVYELMKEDYNKIVRDLQEESKKQKEEIKRIKKDYVNQNNSYEKSLRNIDIIPVNNTRIKPTVEVTNKFKKSSKEIVVRNPSNKTDIEHFDSLQLLKNSIPEIRNAMKEYKAIKLHVMYHLHLENEEDEKDLPLSLIHI